MDKRRTLLLSLLIGLLLAACGEPTPFPPTPTVFPGVVRTREQGTGKEHSTPTPSPPTATPFLLHESACNSSEFDLGPDLTERMSPIVESNRIRGVIDTLSGQPHETTVHAGGDTYKLRGIDLDETDHGRVVDFQGRFDKRDGRIFHVESYAFVPYAVLRGQLRVEELCKMKCDDWLLFEVEQGGQTYTFGLAWNQDEYPELWKRKDQAVTLAGVVYSERNWLGLYGFAVRYICE